MEKTKLETNEDRLLAMRLLSIDQKGMGDDDKFTRYLEVIGEYREKIIREEKKFAENDKRVAYIDQDAYPLRVLNRHQKVDGQIEGGIIPRLSNESQFIREEDIGED